MQTAACFRLLLCDANLNKLLITDAVMHVHSSIEKKRKFYGLSMSFVIAMQ